MNFNNIDHVNQRSCNENLPSNGIINPNNYRFSTEESLNNSNGGNNKFYSSNFKGIQNLNNSSNHCVESNAHFHNEEYFKIPNGIQNVKVNNCKNYNESTCYTHVSTERESCRTSEEVKYICDFTEDMIVQLSDEDEVRSVGKYDNVKTNKTTDEIIERLNPTGISISEENNVIIENNSNLNIIEEINHAKSNNLEINPSETRNNTKEKDKNNNSNSDQKNKYKEYYEKLLIIKKPENELEKNNKSIKTNEENEILDEIISKTDINSNDATICSETNKDIKNSDFSVKLNKNISNLSLNENSSSIESIEINDILEVNCPIEGIIKSAKVLKIEDNTENNKDSNYKLTEKDNLRKFYVHFINYEKRMDNWILPKNIIRIIKQNNSELYLQKLNSSNNYSNIPTISTFLEGGKNSGKKANNVNMITMLTRKRSNLNSLDDHVSNLFIKA